MVLWRPTRPSRTNTLKRCPFHHWGLECKSRKSRDTWNNRQVWPWSTKWSRSKANRVLPRECNGHSKHPLPTTQEKTYTWISPDGQYWNQINYILCSQRWRSSIHSAKTRLGADWLRLWSLYCQRKKVKLLSCVQLSATPWTVAYQAPLFMGFSRQKYWSGLPLPSPK